MASIARARASLRFFGDDLDPDEVTRLLGAQPSDSYRSGEEILGKATTRIAPTGAWFKQSELPPEAELDSHIRSVLDPLTSDLDIWRSLLDRFSADVFCGVFLDHINEGFELSPATSAALGARGLPVAFDIYGAREPDDESAP